MAKILVVEVELTDFDLARTSSFAKISRHFFLHTSSKQSSSLINHKPQQLHRPTPLYPDTSHSIQP
jgi:hypothetical protein